MDLATLEMHKARAYDAFARGHLSEALRAYEAIEPLYERHGFVEGLLALRYNRLLAQAGFAPHFLASRPFRPGEAGEDDFLDACACAWTARRVLTGEAVRFPDGDPPTDPRGLRMEIRA